LILVIFILGTSACAPRNDGKLHVAAAASLAPAFIELSHVFTETTGEQIVLTLSSTGALTEQIRNGAPFDVFASADEEHIDELITGGYLLPDSKVLFASGSLVLLVSLEHKDDVMRLSDLKRAEIHRVAIANPELAPYGIAARQVLLEAGLWEALQQKIIMGETVGQAYIFVTSGNADAGIVARSVLTAESRDMPLIQLATDKPPQHWGAILAHSEQTPLAETFLDFLTTPAARQVLDDFGFQPAGSEP
jgi:molybdate transport system substrate-binding protein